MKANHRQQPTSRRWKAFRYARLCLTNGTGLTGRLNFKLPATPEQARRQAYYKIAVAASDPKVKFDPFNALVIIKPNDN